MTQNIRNLFYYVIIFASFSASIGVGVYYIKLDSEVSQMDQEVSAKVATPKAVIAPEVVKRTETPIASNRVQRHIEETGSGLSNFQYQISNGPEKSSFKHQLISMQFTTNDDRKAYAFIKDLQSGLSGFVLVDEIKLVRHGPEILAKIKLQHYGVSQ